MLDPSSGSTGMRRRGSAEPQESKAENDSIIKRFDIYNKVHDDYNNKTKSGGTLSIITYVSIALLVFGELRWYLTTTIADHIVVDTTADEKLPIGLNITFPDLRCDEVSVDTVDSSGENQIDIRDGGLQKYNIGVDGRLADDFEAPEGSCMSCLAAASSVPEGQCCNNCQQLKEAYATAGISYYRALKTAEQCKQVVGCLVDGDVLVSKVAGNVHVALGKSVVRQGRHVHEFNIRDVSEGFNTSHIINRLQFGPRFDGLVDAPLEGVAKIVDQGAFMFHYYIKLIPTQYLEERDPEGTKRYTHQYSSTEASRNVLVNTEQLAGLPGVFLVYDFSPFLVQKKVAYTPFSRFLTSLCVIVGGVFTIARFLDKVLYATGRKLSQPGGGKRNMAL
ncbi:unnamed protein product [Amoebophrya sp. A25]|nr:unnamed protein product [Amoebophrya sp. A25]|eukprot:GSA25T00016944001.1